MCAMHFDNYVAEPVSLQVFLNANNFENCLLGVCVSRVCGCCDVHCSSHFVGGVEKRLRRGGGDLPDACAGWASQREGERVHH